MMSRAVRNPAKAMKSARMAKVLKPMGEPISDRTRGDRFAAGAIIV
jgi:hypothetical protein